MSWAHLSASGHTVWQKENFPILFLDAFDDETACDLMKFTWPQKGLGLGEYIVEEDMACFIREEVLECELTFVTNILNHPLLSYHDGTTLQVQKENQ